jgi:hypothetical protein
LAPPALAMRPELEGVVPLIRLAADQPCTTISRHRPPFKSMLLPFA